VHLAVAALLMNAVPFTLLAYGEQRISSVDAGLWNATTPLLTLPATIWLIPSERPGRRKVAGLAVGFAGVLLLLGAVPRLDGRTLAGDAMCFAAACSYGLGFPYSRCFLSSSGLAPRGAGGGPAVLRHGRDGADRGADHGSAGAVVTAGPAVVTADAERP